MLTADDDISQQSDSEDQSRRGEGRYNSVREQQKVRIKAIAERNGKMDNNYLKFVTKKLNAVERRKEQLQVKHADFKQHLTRKNLGEQYMREQKYKPKIDCISFHEFMQIHKNKEKFIRSTFGYSDAGESPDADQFEYPLMFLDLIYFLLGQKLDDQFIHTE